MCLYAKGGEGGSGLEGRVSEWTPVSDVEALSTATRALDVGIVEHKLAGEL